MRGSGVRRVAAAVLAGAVAALAWAPATAATVGPRKTRWAATRISSAGLQDLREIVGAGDRIFFVGTTEQQGDELWTSDGTSEGTTMVEDVRPGAEGSTYDLTGGRGVAVGHVLYYVADDGTHGGTLWRSDGTPAGTNLVKDVVPSLTTGYEVVSLTEVGGVLYFIALTGSGMQLWRSDGTGRGTVAVADVGACAFVTCHPGPVVGVGDLLVLVAGDHPDGELWRSDGTAAGTSRLGPTAVRQLTVAGDRVYFTAGSTGFDELWRTDGTAAGTGRVPGAARGGDVVDSYTGLSEVSGALLYMASHSTGTGERYQLRRVDEGTGVDALVRRFRPADGGDLSVDAGNVVAVHGVLFFVPASLDPGVFPGRALWRSDGTRAGTSRLVDGFVHGLARVAGEVVFVRAGRTPGRWRVWHSDGSAAGTESVVGPSFQYPVGDESLVRPFVAEVGGQAFFTGIDRSAQKDLWKVGGDLGAPDTRVTDGFADGQVVTSHASGSERFGFAADDDFTPTAGSVFQVRVDDDDWVETGPAYDFRVRFLGLPWAEGRHTIRVRALDAAGRRDPTPATRSFTIDLAPRRR